MVEEGEKEETSGGEEGEHEHRESRQERSKISILIPPPPTSRTIANCVKRVPPIASSSPPLLKKTRYNPDLTLCHGCGLRFPSIKNNDLSHTRLRLLRSCWRVVLLCKSCLSRAKSAEICSYCFQPVCESAVDCLDCFRRVHLDCARSEHRCFVSRQFDPTKFTCIDCCVIPGPGGGRVSPKCLSSISLVARDATLSVRKRGRVATKDKDSATAQHKAATSEHASKCARNPLGVSQGLKKEAPRSADDGTVVSDEQLALQLHLAINGSRRISRSSR